MEKKLYDEMGENVNKIEKEINLASKSIFLFGHCNSSEELANLLISKNYSVKAILDNNSNKYGTDYKGIPIISPNAFIASDTENSIVLIVTRFYESMNRQLRDIGYTGPIYKLIDYNTYANYSLSEETISVMRKREEHGERLLSELSNKYPGAFKVFCPFNALGDIYFMISYWKAFAEKRGINSQVFCVPGKALTDVICLFGDYSVEVYEQKELDAMIQASLYIQDENSFIAHQDRPYVINLHKALYVKMIPLEIMYRCGVYGLSKDTVPSKPIKNKIEFENLHYIPKGKSVIFSPYAKSVPKLDESIWNEAVDFYSSLGYKCFTNVIGNEIPLENTEGISPAISEMIPIVERAGTFIGIRSGLCDIIREANAKKIALYPDYNYSDTKWKAIDIYNIEQFDYNLLATEDIEWEKL